MTEPSHQDYPPIPQAHPSADIHQHLGRLEGRMDGIQERQTRFELRTDTALGLILDEVRGLTKNRSQAIGGGKALLAAGSVVAFVAGVVMWAITEVNSSRDQTEQKIDALIEMMETPPDDNQ